MRRGFSLVELSIVLVILGLLTGGILSGQSLIRAAELRAASTEFQNYQSAVMSFRDKYFAMPGDMRNATRFWGVQHATPATCAVTASSSALTCDGDGDGVLEHTTLNPSSNEQFRFWQHLANAGLIEGSYTGVQGSGGNEDHVIFGTNTPKSRVSNAGWSARQWASMTFVNNLHALNFGTATTNNHNTGGALLAEEAWNIDTKLDDGSPANGKIRVISNITNCASDTTSAATYILTSTTKACALALLGLK